MTKRVRDDSSTPTLALPLCIGPMPWAERRARLVWDRHVNRDALPACKCLYTRYCYDFGRLRYCSWLPKLIDNATFCSPLQHGDILEFGETVFLLTRVPDEKDMYEAHHIHYFERLPHFRAQDYSVTELALHFVTEEHCKKILTEESYMKRYRAMSEAFVYWVLTHLGFSRDMRRYIAHRVFEH